MQLAIDLDAAYLVTLGTKSCYAGHFYLESLPNWHNYDKPPHNAAIHTECRTLKILCALRQKQNVAVSLITHKWCWESVEP